MLNFDLELKNIAPINIKDMELSKYRINDNIRKSIILYNKSISEIKTNNINLAIEDLKKALKYNRSFCEGIKLLGLCYVHERKYEKAEKTFKMLAEYGLYSDLAKEYLKGLVLERTAAEALDAIKEVNKASISNKKRKLSIKSLKRGIIAGISVLIIFTIGLVTSHWIIPRLYSNSKDVVLIEKIDNEQKQVNNNSEQNKITEDKYNQLDENYKNLQKELDNRTSELDNYKNKYNTLIIISDAEKLYGDGKYEKAASTLLTIKNVNFDDITKVKYDKLFSDIKTNALWSIYSQGNKLYKEGKYAEALPKLKIVTEIDSSLDITPWILHQIGVCYMETKDNDNALLFFQKVIDNYPKTNYAQYSERLINKINNK